MPRTLIPKPCPGCGQIKSISPSSVCRECSEAIRDHARLKAAAEVLEGARFYALTRGISPMGTYGMNGAPAFEVAFANLLGAMCPTRPKDEVGFAKELDDQYTGWHVGDRLPEARAFLVAHKDVPVHIHRVFHAIADLVREGRAEGQLKGQDLLGQLASGELSIAGLNEATFDAKRVIRGR